MTKRESLRELCGVRELCYPTLADLTDTRQLIARHEAGESAYPYARKLTTELDSIISRFERCVWFEGFQRINHDVSFRGFEMKLSKKGQLLTYTMCGRVAVTLRRGGTEFSFVLDESAEWPRGGTNSASGDIDELHEMMAEVVTRWRKGERLVEAPNVGLG